MLLAMRNITNGLLRELSRSIEQTLVRHIGGEVGIKIRNTIESREACSHPIQIADRITNNVIQRRIKGVVRFENCQQTLRLHQTSILLKALDETPAVNMLLRLVKPPTHSG